MKMSGLWIPCLKEGEKVYTLTPEELSKLMRTAFHSGYQMAKDIYNTRTNIEEPFYGDIE